MSSAESGELNNKTDNCKNDNCNRNEDNKDCKMNKSSDKIGNVTSNKRLNEEASDAQSSTYQSYKSNNVYGGKPNQYGRFNKYNHPKKQFIGRDSFNDDNKSDNR